MDALTPPRAGGRRLACTRIPARCRVLHRSRSVAPRTLTVQASAARLPDSRARRCGLMVRNAPGPTARTAAIAAGRRRLERAHEVDATVAAHEPARRHAVRDRTVAQPRVEELRGRDAPVLPAGDDRAPLRVHFVLFGALPALAGRSAPPARIVLRADRTRLEQDEMHPHPAPSLTSRRRARPQRRLFTEPRPTRRRTAGSALVLLALGHRLGDVEGAEPPLHAAVELGQRGPPPRCRAAGRAARRRSPSGCARSP